jgi:hypothetical protein
MKTRIAIGLALLLTTIASSARAQAPRSSPSVQVDAGIAWPVQTVSGLDYTKVKPSIIAEFKIRFRTVHEREYEHLGLGWTLTPGITVRF